jgi:hypothetical protein
MKKLLFLLLLSFNAAAQNTLIEWIPLTEDEEGNLLNDRLAGFNIYYGSSIGMYGQNINIPDPLATYHVIDLAPGVYHGVITAYTVDGMEGEWSEDVSVTVPYTPPKQVTGATWVVSEQ